MRLRLPLLIGALIFAFAFPGVAQAKEKTPVQADVPILPCIDAVVVAINCAPQPGPGPQPQPQPQPEPQHQPQPAPAQSCPGRDLPPDAANGRTVRKATLCLLNEERAKHGRRALRQVGTLAKVAGVYARRMVRERFFEHTSPDGQTFLSRIQGTSYLRGGLKRWSVGENIAWGTNDRSSPEKIVTAWMKSPGHRRNILDPRFNEFGLGIALGAPKPDAGDTPAATYVNEFGQRRR